MKDLYPPPKIFSVHVNCVVHLHAVYVQIFKVQNFLCINKFQDFRGFIFKDQSFFTEVI